MPSINVKTILEAEPAKGAKEGENSESVVAPTNVPAVVNPSTTTQETVKPLDVVVDDNPLLDILGTTTTTPKASVTSPVQIDTLESLLSITKEQNMLSLDTEVAKSSFTVFNKDGLKIDFEVLFADSYKRDVAEVKASFSNSLPTALSDLKFLAAVPKVSITTSHIFFQYIVMELFKASTTTVPPSSTAQVTQKIKLSNTSATEAMKLKFKVSYVRQDTGQVVTEQGSVDKI